MFEWLLIEPLCGIGTTIGFFVSLIIGYHLRKWHKSKKKEASKGV